MGKVKLSLFVFVMVSVLDIIGVLFKIPILVLIFKPLILLSLIALYAASVSKRNKTYVLALIFSFFGDVFLMFNGELYFIIGLASFLIAHILFIKIVVKRIQKINFFKVIISMIPFLVVFFGLLFILKDSLNELLIPVIIYGFTISLFGTVSLVDYLNTKSKKVLFMLIGAIVFIGSDSILAINKFYMTTHVFAVLVMVTYVVAQYFIYKSMILDKKES